MKGSVILLGIRYLAAILAGVVTFGFLITYTTALVFQIEQHTSIHSPWMSLPSAIMGLIAPFAAILLTAWIAPAKKLTCALLIGTYIGLFCAENFVVSFSRPQWIKVDSIVLGLMYLRYFFNVIGILSGVVWVMKPPHRVHVKTSVSH